MRFPLAEKEMQAAYHAVVCNKSDKISSLTKLLLFNKEGHLRCDFLELNSN